MMSKKKWFALYCFYVIYLLLGACVYYVVQSKDDNEKADAELVKRTIIQSQLNEMHDCSIPEGLFGNLSDYCGKPVGYGMKDEESFRKYWDFYHALWFVITVVTTIGYGNIAPTTSFGRMFMIFYALIGVPVNGIIFMTVGDWFTKTFTKLYDRWKANSKPKSDVAKLGLYTQVILYLIPGITFLIFIPAVIITYFEVDWPYDLSVYYCFVTLTTIGFGDYVAGMYNKGFPDYQFQLYHTFLLIWIMSGLGYLIMIFAFITRAMRSRRMKMLEQKIRHNIKKTPVKIRNELRSLLQEFLFMRVKPVYKGDFEYVPRILERSQSCPDLTIYRNKDSPSYTRKRAFSECPRALSIQSDSGLENIDKERTFQYSDNFMEQQELIRKVVDALGTIESEEDSLNSNSNGYDGFSDDEILASERMSAPAVPPLPWNSSPLPAHSLKASRKRAVSSYEIPPVYDQDSTWYGQRAQENLERFRNRPRTLSVPVAPHLKQPGLLTRLRRRLISTSSDRKPVDIEKQDRNTSLTPEERYIRQTARGRVSEVSSHLSGRSGHQRFANRHHSVISGPQANRSGSIAHPAGDHLLEQTSIADFLRALTAITVETSPQPRRKLGTAGIPSSLDISPPRSRRMGIRTNLTQSRRTSLAPEPSPTPNVRRRFSLRPVNENLLAPPPYTPVQALSPATLATQTPQASQTSQASQGRRFSRVNNPPSSVFVSPVQRQVNRKDSESAS